MPLAAPTEPLAEFDFARPRVVQTLRRQADWKQRLGMPMGTVGALLIFPSLVGLVLFLFFGSTSWFPGTVPIASVIGLGVGWLFFCAGKLALTQAGNHRAEAERLVAEHLELTGERIEP
jgi:hypothetical protein